jgi:hypothetical protein
MFANKLENSPNRSGYPQGLQPDALCCSGGGGGDGEAKESDINLSLPTVPTGKLQLQ